MDRSSIYTFDIDQSETRYSVEYIHVVSVVNALCRKKYPIEYNFIVDICQSNAKYVGQEMHHLWFCLFTCFIIMSISEIH